MYNEELKKAFIECCLEKRFKDKSLSETMVYSIFKKTTLPFEDKYGTDAAFFTEDQILEMFKAKNSRSLQSLLNTLVILRQYAAYVLASHAPSLPNIYELVTSERLKECVSSKADEAILSRDDIDILQSKMLNAVDKAILECLFIGISGKNLEDLTYLDSTQLDTASKTVTLKSGKIVALSNRQIELLQDAFSETESISYLENGTTSKVDGLGRLYKQKPNAHDEDTADKRFRWVQRRFHIWKDHFGLGVLTMKSVSLSGLVHSLKTALNESHLKPRDFLRTPDGRALAYQYDYDCTAQHYVDVIHSRVKKYL